MNTPQDQLPREVLDAFEQGRIIDAIKILRKLKGMGLVEAKAVLEAAARMKAGQMVPPVPSGAGAADSGRVLPREVLEAVQRGDKKAAIKLLRQRTGIGLQAAKERIDAAAGGGTNFGSATHADSSHVFGASN